MPALCSVFDQNEPFEGLQEVQLELGTTAADLQALVGSLNESSDDEVQYAFFLNDVQITKTLGEAIYEQGMTLEELIKIKAVPQERVNVSALSRCQQDLPGHEDAVLCVQFAPNSRYVASGSGDKTVRIWDCYTGTCRTILRGHDAWVLALRYSPDGTRLVSADYNGALTVWNCENYTRIGGQRPLGRGTRYWVTCVYWDYTSLRFFTGSKDGVIRMFDRNGGFIRYVGGHSKAVTCLASTGRFLISASEDCTVHIQSLEDFALVGQVKHAHWVNYVSSNYQYLVRFGIFGLSRLFNLYRQQLTALGFQKREELLAPENATKAAQALTAVLHPATESIVTASDDHTLQLTQIYPAVKRIAQMAGHARQINQAVFSPNGQFIASCSFDRTVRLWSGTDGKFLHRYQAHASEVYAVVFSSDSRLILSGGKDSTCKCYSVKQRRLLRELPGHSDEVYCVDWSLDGEYGVSGSKDRLVKLWKQ